jgi:hypothetical protein
MVIVKKNYFRFLAIPISVKLFGSNKTLRGFLILTFLNTIFSWLIYKILGEETLVNPLFSGFILGFVYMLFELPNSFLKRRIGINSGEKGTGFKYLFVILDKTDSVFGVSIISSLLYNFSFKYFIILFSISVIVHVFFSQLLVLLGIKKSF